MNSVVIFDEPQLEFASGERLEHPRDGLTLFGPVDSKGVEKPSHLSYGVVGTKSGVAALRKFVKTVVKPISTDAELDDVLWPHFPGLRKRFMQCFQLSRRGLKTRRISLEKHSDRA